MPELFTRKDRSPLDWLFKPRALDMVDPSSVEPAPVTNNGTEISPEEQAYWISRGAQPNGEPRPSTGIAPATPSLNWIKPAKQDFGQAPVISDAMTKRQELANVVAQKPAEEKQPWWKQALKAAAGAGMGWANAQNPRAPIDIDRAAQGMDRVVNPGYYGKLSDWAQRADAAKTAADIADQNEKAWWTRQENESQMDSRAAQAERDRAAGAYDTRRAEAEQNQWKIDAKGRILNTITGEVKNPAPTPQERFDEAKQLGVSDEQAKYYALNGKMPEPEKPATPPRPTVLGPGSVVYDPENKKPVFSAPFAPREPRNPNWQVKTSRDNNGNVYEWRVNPDTGESTEPVLKGKIGPSDDSWLTPTEETPAPAAAPQPPPQPGRGSAAPGGEETIRVRRKSDGQTGSIKAKDFNASKYERL